jgi:hypothetical protein
MLQNTERKGDRSWKMTPQRFTRSMVLGVGAALICAPGASADNCQPQQQQYNCPWQPPQPQPKLTQWVAATNSWFLNADWDQGVPSNIDTARVDNAGTAEIRNAGAVAAVLEVGFSPLAAGAGEGTVSLYSGGTLSVSKAEYLGLDGRGNFFQFGGSHAVAGGSLTLGKGAAAAGSYFLMDGSLTVKSGTIIGKLGRGSFFQDSGSHRIECGALTLAQAASAQGSYAMYGGSLLVSGDENVGLNGSAAFDQFGGTNTAACGTLYVGKKAGSSAAYGLHNGTLQVGEEVLGQDGDSAFNQYGGFNIVSDSFTAGVSATGSDAYDLSGGCMAVCGNETWGVDGVGVYYQEGGAHYIGSTLTVGGHADAVAFFEIQEGALSAKQIQVGMLGGEGFLGIYGPDPIVTVQDTITLGPDAKLATEDGATIHMTGSAGAFRNTSTNELALEGLDTLAVVFEGGVTSGGFGNHNDDSCNGQDSDNDSKSGCSSWGSSCGDNGSACGSHAADQGCSDANAWATFEVAGKDLGGIQAGFTQNFALNGLLVGGAKAARVQLVDASDNGNRRASFRHTGNEALYTHKVVVTKGSTLDLNGLKVYCDGTVNIQGTLLNGSIVIVP